MGGAEDCDCKATEAYESLMRCSAARLLRELEFNVFDSEDGDTRYEDLIHSMVRHGLPKTLERLIFDVKSWQLSWSALGDLSRLYPQLRRLTSLRIKVGRMDLGATMDLPNLQSLEIVTGGFTPANMASLTSVKWSMLESLILYFGDPAYGGECAIEDVAPILDRSHLPNVRHLGLCNAYFADDLARAVMSSDLVPQLRVLDLSQGTLGDDGALALLRGASALSHLERIDLASSYLSEEMVARLSATFPTRIDLRDQQEAEDIDERYVQIAE
jgi:hypothetical protein